mgnify:CR=1 FL=1
MVMSSKLIYHISPHEVVTLEEPDEQILWTSPGIELGSTGCELAMLPRRHGGRYGNKRKTSYLTYIPEH